MRTVTLALAMVLLGTAVARADNVIIELGAPTPVSAYGGRVLWSERDAGGRFHLVTRSGGISVRVPVAARRVAFDADVGPTADHHVAAVYSRCRKDPPSSSSYGAPMAYERGRGCDLYEYDFATHSESRVADASSPVASEVWPTIWRGRIAFERVYDDQPHTPYLYTRVLGSGRRSRRLPAGPRRGCAAGSCGVAGRSHATGLDLRGRRLAFAWTFSGIAEGLATQIRIDTLRGSRQLVDHEAGGGLTHVAVVAPSLDARRIYWARACYGDPAGCPGRFGLRRRRLGGGRTERAPGPAQTVWQVRDRAFTYVLGDTMNGTCVGDPGGQPTCKLVVRRPAYG